MKGAALADFGQQEQCLLLFLWSLLSGLEVLGILSILLAQAINRMVCLEAVWLKWPILLARVTNRMVCLEAV